MPRSQSSEVRHSWAACRQPCVLAKRANLDEPLLAALGRDRTSPAAHGSPPSTLADLVAPEWKDSRVRRSRSGGAHAIDHDAVLGGRRGRRLATRASEDV